MHMLTSKWRVFMACPLQGLTPVTLKRRMLEHLECCMAKHIIAHH